MDSAQINSMFLRGLSLHQQGELDRAKAIYESVLKTNKNHFDSLQLLGVICIEQKQYPKAVELISKALKIQNNQAPCYYNLGNAYLGMLHYEDAITCYDKAVSLNQNFSEAFFNRARILEELHRFDEAVASYNAAIASNQGYSDAYLGLGNAFYKMGRLDEAIASYDKAIAIKNDFAIAFHDRGVAFQELQRLDEAIASYDRAIAIKHDYADAYCNRGYALQECQLLEDAIASYKKAIDINGDYPEASWNLSLCQLQIGDLDEGWKGFEWRWKIEDTSSTAGVRQFKQKLWLGTESLAGKTILLHAEQGFGDTIQFCRFANLVAKLGAKVILEVQPSLVNLLKSIDGVSRVVARGNPLPDFDFQCPLMSLPLALKINLKNIPAATRSLAIDIEQVKKWETVLSQRNGYRVGLAWSGRGTHKNDSYRSITLSQLIAELPSQIEYICLQNEIRDIDRDLVSESNVIQYFGDSIADFSDTAALCSLVDLVISVDTSVAHLSATLGRPTWLLLPHNADWRWLANRDDSPWYPTIKIYRQKALGDWGGVLKQVQADLLDFKSRNTNELS